MIRAPVKDSRVYVGLCAACESVKKVGNEFGLQIAHQTHANFRLDYRRGASRKIYRCHPESFVHRHNEIPCAQNAALVPQRLREGLPESDADIFDGMVLVYIEVAFGCELQIKSAVIGKEFQHMVEKSNAGRYFMPPFALDREANADTGFFGDTINCGFPHRDTFW